jgi:hypothetical protein
MVCYARSHLRKATAPIRVKLTSIQIEISHYTLQLLVILTKRVLTFLVGVGARE